MDLSVVIVNYNVRHFLEQCLHSVMKASSGLSCEIIVVDNNSADGSCSMVSSGFPEVILIRNFKNTGFSAACNQAISISKGKYILLLNPDTVVEENTFRKCIGFMDDKPFAGAVGVKMVNGSGKLLPESKRSFPTPATAFFKMAGLSRLFPKSPFFNRYYLGHLDSSKITEADIISGAFMFIRREALDKTGLLDESFFMYGEDIDLSYRLIIAGYKNYYSPELTILHYKGESTKKTDVNYIIHFYKAMLIFISKHFGNEGYGSLRLILRAAIFFRGTAAIIKNFLRRYILPVTDILVITMVFLLVSETWAGIKFGGGYHYPGLFSYIIIPSYAILSLIAIFLTGGYRIPSRLKDVAKGLAASTLIILVIYSLIDETFKSFSLFSGVSLICLLPATNDSKGIPRYLFSKVIILNVKALLPFNISDTLVFPPNKGAISACLRFICSILNLIASIGSGDPV